MCSRCRYAQPTYVKIIFVSPNSLLLFSVLLFYYTLLIIFLCLYNSADEVLLKPTGAQLTVEFLEEHSFSVPVMVLRRDGLGMTLPPSSFGVTDVEHYIGKVPKVFLQIQISIHELGLLIFRHIEV